MQEFECSDCKYLFYAHDADLIARRGGRCSDCTRMWAIRVFGLPHDFLDKGFGI